MTSRKSTDHDECLMQRAIELGVKGMGRTSPNPPVGAVVVNRGSIVGEGFHRRAGGAHAEIEALSAAGASLYVTLEPCSTSGRTGPCTDEIIRRKVRRVIISATDPNPSHNGRGIRVLRRAGIGVVTGICADPGRELIAPFRKWITRGLPFLTLKMAMSLDGRIADCKGHSKWITGESSRSLVKRMRGRVDAVMVGSRTACKDNPSLTARPCPFRIILNSAGSLPLTATVLNDDHVERTVIAVAHSCSLDRERSYTRKGAAVWRIGNRGGHLSLRSLFRRMAKEEILHVLCEGGSELADSLLRDELIDELLFFIAPSILGGKNAVPVIGGTSDRSLDKRESLVFAELGMSGRDILARSLPAGDRCKNGASAIMRGLVRSVHRID
jgi:diaminohydroxyphosphoribosylaminopyrimidine deaminase/5-amino-6-(5-phosphoribosylamino)uracil reductase